MVETVKHAGGSVMMWGCIAASDVGNLVIIHSILDRYDYLNILKQNLHDSTEKLNLKGLLIFQQDNNSKHTSHIVKQWMLHNVPKQLKTLPQSPDINLIEHL
jgi:hypothetical protein